MATVRVLRPPLCSDAAHDLAAPQWPLLVEARRKFCREIIPDDCRMLVFFIEDGEKANWLGYETRDQYLTEGLGLDPRMVGLALRGLQISDPQKATGLNDAIVLGVRGRPKKGKEKGAISTLKRGSTARAYILARLDRDRPDLAAKVHAGLMSANAAAIEAGFRKRATPYELVLKLLPKLTTDERQELFRIL